VSLPSVEALLDAATDAAVRQEWAALAAGGLPVQAAHEGSTNAPHITLSAAAGVPHLVEGRIGGSSAPCCPCPCVSDRWV
jgi:hypothetical protein